MRRRSDKLQTGDVVRPSLTGEDGLIDGRCNPVWTKQCETVGDSPEWSKHRYTEIDNPSQHVFCVLGILYHTRDSIKLLVAWELGVTLVWCYTEEMWEIA